MIDGYLTIREVAEKLGVSEGRIRQFVAEKRVQTIKVGKSNLIPEGELSKITIYGKVGRPPKTKETNK
ncbi:MAG TPA: helix-turn-helix domain-containing protein [Pyrinomonadaceae bacterium]|nr:helix-turn-helix domain-containing protein [Pyrinomonadaceae bacterium]